jgi:FkbM family methyltransferase
MIKAFVYIFNFFKKYFRYSAFTRSLIDTKNKKSGFVNLHESKFHYHYGLAFYETYQEIFEKKIYEFKTDLISPVILDCGANMGLSVLYFSKLMPHSKIIAFEPDSSVLPFLEKNLVSQKLHNVELHKKAVWIEETELSFYTDNGLGGRIGMEYKDQNASKIKTVRLKEFLNQPIAMLKIDIEGSEFDVIKDCESLLCNVEHLFIEYHSVYNEEQNLDIILLILKRQGFRYHLRESFSRRKPFLDKKLVCEKYDMAINVFGYKNSSDMKL